MRATIGSLLLATAFLAGCSTTPEPPGATVGPEEVQRELVGKVWTVELPDGAPATEYFNADGTVRIVGGLNDSGHWRLWEKGYCTQWQRMRHGAERCFTLDRTPDGKYLVYKPSGEISMTVLSRK
jgi:hypothetical protein